jgi:hypothetical protein
MPVSVFTVNKELNSPKRVEPVAEQSTMAAEARQQAQAEKLTLLVAENSTGYFGVHHLKSDQPRPFLVQVWRGGNKVYLGMFATAEEAALCVARSPEGRAEAADRAVLTGEDARQQAQAEKLTLLRAREQLGLLRREPRQARPAQAL